MTETQVRTEKKEAGKQHVAWITLQSDNGLNVLGSASVSTLLTEITALSNDQSIRALVLTGSGGKAFIGGADIREMRELDQESKMLCGAARISCSGDSPHRGAMPGCWA